MSKFLSAQAELAIRGDLVTSHYARCLVRNSFESVFDALSQGFGNIHARKLSISGQLQAAIILGEKYFFRNESDAAVSIILEQLPSGEAVIEVVAYAGASGLLESRTVAIQTMSMG
jgi:hypothetical protein